MDLKTLSFSSPFPIPPLNNYTNTPKKHSFSHFTPHFPSLRRQITVSCISPVDQNRNLTTPQEEEEFFSSTSRSSIISSTSEEEENIEEFEAGNESNILKQIKEIGLFAGPAVGLWICGPLMSLIDTAVIGQGSSLELAALGPGTVVCDYTSYVFMFLSIATSNMVATSIAREGKKEVQHKISILLFVGFTCGVGMLLLTKVMGAQILTAFTGPKNLSIVPAANTYVQVYLQSSRPY